VQKVAVGEVLEPFQLKQRELDALSMIAGVRRSPSMLWSGPCDPPDGLRPAGYIAPADPHEVEFSSRSANKPLGSWGRSLLSDLVERGLDPEQGMLFVIDGAKALRQAIRSVFGEVPVQRCVRHKERNVTDHLPERDRPLVKARLRKAWAESDHHRALELLRQLATELERIHPGAVGSLREGIEETLTLTRLGITGRLKRTRSAPYRLRGKLRALSGCERNPAAPPTRLRGPGTPST
jgi:hypothetical protein